jgi:hypothetical protein
MLVNSGTMKKMILTLSLSTLLITLANASDIIMSASGTYTVSSANFYDAGGPSTDYLNNQDVIITLLPALPGAKVSVTFNSFTTAVLYYDATTFSSNNNDILYIYNGNSTEASQIGAMRGVGYGTVTSTSADGSLTFRFVSHAYYNTSGIKAGWSATISCSSTPPNDITMIGGTFTTCGGKFYDAGGPDGDYMNNQNSTLTLFPATPGAKVSVTFDSFTTAVGYYDASTFSSNNNDILYVYNGNSTAATQIGAMQGTGYGTVTSTAADGSLTFKFVSHAYSNTNGIKAGWSATISCISTPPDDITMIGGTFTTCGGKFYDAGGPDGDYMNNQNTTLTIYPATPGAKVSVTFDYFNTAVLYYDATTFSSNNSDILYVYNGNSITAPQIGALQGQGGYGTIASTADDGSLTFKFISHALTNNTGLKKGWSATISCSSSSLNGITMIAGTAFTTCNGKFYDSGGPDGDYMNNQNSTLTIYPATAGAKVSVTFDYFNTAVLYYDASTFSSNNNDVLYVYNGNSIAAPQIGALQGQNGYGTVTSTADDGTLTFKFISHALANDTGLKKGWSATITCSSAPPSVITMIAGTAFTTGSAKFYDSGGPDGDYMNNQNSTLTIHPTTAGAKVSVTFDYFSTAIQYYDASTFSSNNNDILYVYDGNSIAGSQIGALQGQVNYGTITSTADDGSLTFKFVSHALDNSTGIKKGWSASVSCNSGSKVYVYPGLSLSAAQVQTGQTITISGKQFTPSGKVDLSFSGPGSINPFQDYGIDGSGNFQYILTIASLQKSGSYVLTATDKITGKSAYRTFQIVENTIKDDLLTIVEPNISKLRLVDDPIVIAWEDKVKFNVNPIYNYKHSYKLEYKRDTEISSGSWQLIKDIQGTNSGYGTINISTSFTPTLDGQYMFRVTDNYYPGRSAVTPTIPVTGYTDQNIKILFKWDKSYNSSQITSPEGVAADGVARFYIVVSNISPVSNGINKIKVTLSDPENYESTQYLGKVMYCSFQKDTLTFEGDNANSITSENTSSNIDGKYWFWYVAPEDFARNEGDWVSGDRIITANFNITFLDGNTITTKRDIKIARPPLMLVHGLNGDPGNTWGNFQVGSNNPLYDEDPRFKIKRAVLMEPTSHFNVNSNLLLGGIEKENSFMSLINEMRNEGYACCQVDYVCHSMGGSILRNAVENSLSYLRKNSYRKGYVHKFISLNTPHQGSSFANVLNDVASTWIVTSPVVLAGAIEKLIEVYPTIKVVDAVEDLKYLKGVKFHVTNVKSHLIGSGIPCSEFNLKTSFLYEVLEQNLGLLVPYSGILNQCNWYQTYFNLFGYESDFMNASDAVVSLKSQFSGNNPNALPSFCTRINGPMHNSTFGDSPTTSPAVWDRVNELLNKNVNSDLFNSMPATKVSGKKLAQSTPKQNITLVEDRIKIHYPAANAKYNVGDTINIMVQIDTTGLKSFAFSFQDQSFFDIPVSPDIEYRLIAGPEFIESQPIIILGNYFISGNASISSANIDIEVNPLGTILDFNVQPEVMIIEKNKTRRPDYQAIFSDAITQIGQTDLITAIIKDPDLVSYNSITNEFTGLQTGSTMATISYKGKSKTVFFEIIQYEEAPVDIVTGIEEIENDKTNQLDVAVYPNPTNGVFTIASKEKDYELSVHNIFGERILSLKDQNEKSEIDLRSQPVGIYFVHFHSRNGNTTKKIIISK